MVSLSKNATLSEYADFIYAVYGVPNDRYYSLWDMLINIQRFSMRGIKGIRKGNTEKMKLNILIALSWYASLMNRLHIRTEDIVWERFPYLCSYCGKLPCACKADKINERQKIIIDNSKKPQKIEDFQLMFRKIYPPENRSKEEAAIHLAEEVGELSEAFHIYMGDRSNSKLQEIHLESADLFSCIMGVMNSFDLDCAEELSTMFSNNCHFCNAIPCVCSFETVSYFRS